MKNLKYKIAGLFILFLAVAVQAQVYDVVNVKTKFDAKLKEAKKFEMQPRFPAPDSTTKALDYEVAAKLLEQQYDPPKIRPIAYKMDKLPSEPNFQDY